MASVVLVAPGPLEARTGGYIYDRRIVEGLRHLGWQVDALELDSTFPHPTPDALEQAKRTLADVSAGTITIVDSLALGAMPEIISGEASRLPVVHSSICSGCRYWIDPEEAARFEDGERRALAAATLSSSPAEPPPVDRTVRRRSQPGRGRRAWNRSRAAGARFPNQSAGAPHRGDAQPGKRTRDAARSAVRRERFGVAADLCRKPHARSRDGRARAHHRRTASAGASCVIRWRSRSSRAGGVLRPRDSRSSHAQYNTACGAERWRTGSRSSPKHRSIPVCR